MNENKIDVLEKQIGGNHYKLFPLQPMVFFERHNIPFTVGNAMKYILRHKYKNGVEDLKKALHCVEFLIERSENNYKTTLTLNDVYNFVNKNREVIDEFTSSLFIPLCRFIIFEAVEYLEFTKALLEESIRQMEAIKNFH